MRRSPLVVIGIAVGLAALSVPAAHGDATPADPRPVYGPKGPEEFRFLQKTIHGQSLPANAYANAAAQAAELDDIGGAWQTLGPTNIGGRVVSLALDPLQDNAIYLAAATGGLWRSTDAGATFQTAWPDDATQAMGAVATASDGTVYVGTGEPNPGGGSVTYEGTGVYKSTDQGATWANIGLPASGNIGGIIIDPNDPNRVFVAATGSLYNGGGDRGVYFSPDAGATWSRVLDMPNDFTGAVDVQFDPNDPTQIYAALWDHQRTPSKRLYGGVGSGLYKSSDGGATWAQLGGGFPASGPDIGRIGFGISASEPGRVYAIVSNTNGNYYGFYTSGDGGTSWSSLSASGVSGSQSSYGWWFGKVWVDPANSGHLLVAGVNLMTSNNGGQSFSSVGGVHPDQHAMVWDPNHDGRVYLGNDGGEYRSESRGDGGYTKATYEPFTQLYSGAISPQDTTRISGGAQDNGSIRSWGGGSGFNEYYGGDGEQNLINPTNKNNVFACYQYGECARSTNGGSTMSYFGAGVTASRKNWFTPVQFDPNDPNVLYYGGNRLNRSTNGGASWTPISPDLTSGPGDDPSYVYGTITTVAASKADANTLWVGTDDGHVWVTHDLGANWTNVLEGQPWVTRVVPDPADAGTAYVTLSGYRGGSPQPHVLKTTDSGATFTDLSGNLPQAPVNCVVLGPNGFLYACTDQGVFALDPATPGTWARLGTGLPLVPVDDIAYDPGHNRLVAATFGRGFYELTVP